MEYIIVGLCGAMGALIVDVALLKRRVKTIEKWAIDLDWVAGELADKMTDEEAPWTRHHSS